MYLEELVLLDDVVVEHLHRDGLCLLARRKAEQTLLGHVVRAGGCRDVSRCILHGARTIDLAHPAHLDGDAPAAFDDRVVLGREADRARRLPVRLRAHGRRRSQHTAAKLDVFGMDSGLSAVVDFLLVEGEAEDGRNSGRRLWREGRGEQTGGKRGSGRNGKRGRRTDGEGERGE